MIMLGSVTDPAFDQLQKIPKALGGIETQSAYIVVDDIDDHYRLALKANAEMVMQSEDQAQGRRMYACGNPEGDLWNFGSYPP
jgi:uncharacterized glyoxalase superfamily protein PhnB